MIKRDEYNQKTKGLNHQIIKRPNNQNGFALIELLISIMIFSLIITTSVVSFNNWKKREALRQGAREIESAIRKVQAISLAPEEIGGSIPLGGYGIFFDEDLPTDYLLFADDDGNYDYDDGSDTIIDNLTLPEFVSIKAAGLSPTNGDNELIIIFKPPRAQVYINQSTTLYNEALIELNHSAVIETVAVRLKRITGQINIE